MCTHRVTTRWGRIWDTYTAAVVTTFVVLETYGLVTEGPDATYSHNVQTKVGAVTPCRHTWIGRLSLASLFGWALVHLGWGRGGLNTVRRVLHKFSRAGRSPASRAGSALRTTPIHIATQGVPA